jgi:hypothetical protein
MNRNRDKLRLLYVALCTAQLIIMGLGLAVAYQIEKSYSRNIAYENSVNAEHQAMDQLEVFARAASPEILALDDNSSGPGQLSQISYSSGLFLRKAQDLLYQSER